MSVTELQKQLIEKISKTDDAELLSELYSFLGADQEVSSFYTLSDAQLSIVEESQQQIKQGNSFTNEEVDKEIDQWLDK